MKERFAHFLVVRSRIILIIFIALALGCAALIPLVNINKDMTEYLPRDSAMRHGLDLMKAEFGDETSSSLEIMFDDLKTPQQKTAMLSQLETLPYADSIDYNLPDKDTDQYYNKGNYTRYVINCEYDQYSDEATELWKEAKERFTDEGNAKIGGTIHSANDSGLPIWIVVLAVILVAAVLIIMASSWVEPLTFLITIGIAVLINLGTYVFFPSISKTTFSIVGILQLALSMDYSIMLLNRYRQQRALTSDKREAMEKSLSLSFSSITGSSFTTFAGLLALVFMSFTMGADVGLSLAKGVLISLLCIFTVLPALILGFDSLMLKTIKPTIPFDLPRLSAAQYKLRIPLTLFFALMLAGSFTLRNGVDFSYAQSWMTDIDKVFGHTNTMVMMYDEEDGRSAGKLADLLDDDPEIHSAVCYENTLGKQRKATDMRSFIEDMRDEGENNSDIDLTDSTIRLIYYDYHKGDPDFTMTIPRFVAFIRSDIMDDPDFENSIDQEVRDQIDDMDKFTDRGALTSPKNAAGLAGFFGMKKSEAGQLLLYEHIQSGKGGNNMSLPRFLSFLVNDVADHPQYGNMIDDSQKAQVRSTIIYTNKDEMTSDKNYTQAAKLLGMDENQMRLVYVYKQMEEQAAAMARAGAAGSASGASPTGQAGSPGSASGASPTGQAGSPGSAAQGQPGAPAPPGKTILQVADTLTAMSKDPALADRFGSEETAKLIAGLQQIGQMDPSAYDVPSMMVALTKYGIPLDAETLTFIYAYADADYYMFTIQEMVGYMLSSENISGTLTPAQKSQLSTLKKIIDESISGKKLSPKTMGNILGMSPSDVKKIYALNQYMHGDTRGWKMTPQQFINFLVDEVLGDSSLNSGIGDRASDLKFAKKMINVVVDQRAFTHEELSDFFDDYRDDMSADDIGLIYSLYGSKNFYEEKWTMDIMQFVTHLDTEIVRRPSFAKNMEEDQIEDVHKMRGDMDEAAELLEGKHYGRMMITAKMEEDSDETRAFMADLNKWTDDNFKEDVYMIGNTPMAWEMSRTFKKELNKITLLTAFFILFIVLLTFRRAVAPVVLVLIIQCAVFLTMALLTFLNIDMQYMALLIVQSIMMGATIDYAIIYTTYYIENRQDLKPLEAIRASYKGSLQTILTSAIILIAAVGAISFAFADPSIRQICRILSLGSLLATILVIFILPAILSCLDRFIAPKSAGGSSKQ